MVKFCSIEIPQLLSILLASLITFGSAAAAAHNVTYDRRSLIIDGQRKLLISASIHYPRSVPKMWPGLVQTAKEGGIDVIESYVFWNGHELSPDKYYFGGRYDLVKFVKIVQQAGMYMILRIGPFVAAEWNFGGVPVWLHYVPGTIFRTDNEPFKHYMQKFMNFIVNLMNQEKLFASQGGPIILAQVENEYGDIERIYGDGGKPYAMWAASMALSQNIGVPWIMCQQYDAPDPVMNEQISHIFKALKVLYTVVFNYMAPFVFGEIKSVEHPGHLHLNKTNGRKLDIVLTSDDEESV